MHPAQRVATDLLLLDHSDTRVRVQQAIGGIFSITWGSTGEKPGFWEKPGFFHRIIEKIPLVNGFAYYRSTMQRMRTTVRVIRCEHEVSSYPTD
jgi:hypothetical protein